MVICIERSNKMSFEAGKQAALNGKSLSDNPHTCGFTKLGSVKLTEEGIEWQNGFNSTVCRVASQKETQAARSVDVSRFKRKSNRHYS
jgi:hypothetical protein